MVGNYFPTVPVSTSAVISSSGSRGSCSPYPTNFCGAKVPHRVGPNKDPHSAWHRRRSGLSKVCVPWDREMPARREMIHAYWHRAGRLGRKRPRAVCVCVCGRIWGEAPFTGCHSRRAALEKGCWQIRVHPWGHQRDCSRSSVSLLMTSLLGRRPFCPLLFVFLVTVCFFVKSEVVGCGLLQYSTA